MISESQIRSAIKAADIDVDSDSIPVDKPFRDCGLDSLDMFNILLEIEKITNMQIPDESIENLISIAAIKDYLNRD